MARDVLIGTYNNVGLAHILTSEIVEVLGLSISKVLHILARRELRVLIGEAATGLNAGKAVACIKFV
ncbi:hypothetical protein [Sorlinia euscelidii]